MRSAEALGRASPRVVVRTLGTTTLGRPSIAAFIGGSATIADLSRYQALQRRLADPRLLAAGELPRTLADGKVVVLVTSSIHSTEVGGILSPLVLAQRLVGGDDAEAALIRRNALTILVPSLNPDGVDIVGGWYKSSLGTPWEGTGPPVLYHHYTGHDNNRDWYAFTQAETRLVVDSLNGVWHPQVANDIHQQGSAGTRIFIPPYMDPIEPNIDPILMAGVAQMGKAMTWRLTAQGFPGIANNTSYDAWTPARAYQHYHGAIRILTETASAALATPTRWRSTRSPRATTSTPRPRASISSRAGRAGRGASATSCAIRPRRIRRTSRPHRSRRWPRSRGSPGASRTRRGA